MKILVVSDWIDQLIYSEKMKYRMKDIDIVISCGDLSFQYLDFIMSELNKPLYYVVGNHVSRRSFKKNEFGDLVSDFPKCFKNLHLKHYKEDGKLMAGFEGCVWYNGGPFQYRQWKVYFYLLKMIPRLLFNKIIYGRYLDIFVAHSPPYKVGDREDPCHTGLKAFNWFIKVFKPKVFLHGHVHLYNRNVEKVIRYYETDVINCSGFYTLEIE
ncbi:MAG: metallophosphoesterase [Spirochaetes bacterium]|nr:metallophosphoesterase [Spirochaetota bacterium]